MPVLPGRIPGKPARTAGRGLLILAFPVSMLARGIARVTVLIGIGGLLAGMAVGLWKAAQAPGDWMNYLFAAWQFFLFTWWLTSRRARAGRA